MANLMLVTAVIKCEIKFKMVFMKITRVIETNYRVLIVNFEKLTVKNVMGSK